MRKMKKVVSLALVGAMVFSMTACGKKPAETTPSAAPEKSGAPVAEAPKNPVTLKTVTQMGGTDPNAKVYKELCDAFQAENDYIKIEDDSTAPDQDWKTKIAADFSVGNEPDVIQYFTDANAEDVYKTDKFISLDEIKKVYPDYGKNITEGAYESTKSPVDGVNYAVPTTGYWEGLFCNKDLFDKFKVELPTDWDKFTKAVEVFKKNDIVPVAVSLVGVPHYWIEHLMLSGAGADEYTSKPDDGKAPEGWAKGLALFKDLKDMGAFPEDTDTMDEPTASNLFKEKKAAMQIDGSWFANGIEDKETTTVIAFPKIPGAKVEDGVGIAGFSTGFFISKKAWDDPDKRDAAVKFVMANTSDEQISKYWQGNGKAASNGVTAPAEMTPLAQAGADLASSFTKTVTPTDARFPGEPYTTLIDSAVSVASGAMTAEDAIAGALAVAK